MTAGIRRESAGLAIASGNVRFPSKADVGPSKLPRSRGRDEDEADDREDRTASDPRALVNHEAGCRPMDEAGALADPQQSDQQCDEAQDQ